MSTVLRPAAAVNEELINELHEAKLNKFRKYPLVRPESLKSRLLFAIRRLPRPLQAMTNDEVKLYIEGLRLPPHTRFEVVRAINETLKYLGRVGLKNPRPVKLEEVTYVPMEVFLRDASRMREEFANVIGSIYATGARLWELPLLKVGGDWALIERSISPEEVIGPTKNKRKRHAAILPQLKSFIMAYKALPMKRQVWLCHKAYKRLYGASKRLYGANMRTFRHSYAIECIKAGKSVKEVAEWIGDNEDTTKTYYIGYLMPTKGPWD